MIKKNRSKSGQALTSEYAIALVLGVAAAGSMFFYFKRALQGKIRDANIHMIREVMVGSGGSAVNVLLQYEPYYTTSNSETDLYTVREEKTLAGGVLGLDTKLVRDEGVYSVQLPPKEAD